ncbi:unnamed protein product [[Candida] boidinii]|nr:unnamed protein product [[Candida] boidinii]
MSSLKLHEIQTHKINDSTEALLSSSKSKENNHNNNDNTNNNNTNNNNTNKLSENPIDSYIHDRFEISNLETEYTLNSNSTPIRSPNSKFIKNKLSQAFESFLIFNESLYNGLNESFAYLLETKDSLKEKINYGIIKNKSSNITNSRNTSNNNTFTTNNFQNNRKIGAANNKRYFVTSFIYTLLMMILVSIIYQELELLTYNDIDINSYNSNNYSRNKKDSMLKNYSLMYSSKIKNRLGISAKRSDENYYFEYINSKFYLENPSLHGINPFNTTETVERLMSRFPYRQKKFTNEDLDIIKRDDKEEDEAKNNEDREKEKSIEMKEKEEALRKEMEIEFELRKIQEEKIEKEVKEELSKEKELIAQKEEKEEDKDKEGKVSAEGAEKDKQKEDETVARMMEQLKMNKS